MKRLYNRMCAYAQSLSRVQLLATLWTVAHQAPLSMGFPRLEHWIGLPFPSSGVLPNPGIEPMSPGSPALADAFFTTESITESPCYAVEINTTL